MQAKKKKKILEKIIDQTANDQELLSSKKTFVKEIQELKNKITKLNESLATVIDENSLLKNQLKTANKKIKRLSKIKGLTSNSKLECCSGTIKISIPFVLLKLIIGHNKASDRPERNNV